MKAVSGSKGAIVFESNAWIIKNNGGDIIVPNGEIFSNLFGQVYSIGD